jgi:hypothetical protein
MACKPDTCELLDRLGEVRELVASEFDALLRDGQAGAAAGAPAAADAAAAPGRCPWTASACTSACRRRWPIACAAGRRSRAWPRCATRPACAWAG